MTSVKVIYRPSSKVGRPQGSLSLRMIHNRSCKNITIPDCRLYEDEWDNKNQTLIYPSDSPVRTGYLEAVQARIHSEKELIRGFISMLEENGRYTIEDVLALYRERKDESKLLGYAERLSKEMEKYGQYRTAKAYRTVARNIVRFNKGQDIPLQHINACLIKEYEVSLRNSGRLPNTISYHMRNLRAVFNKALKERRISSINRGNPFEDVYTGVTRTMKRALSLEEIQKLHSLDLNTMIRKEMPESPRYIYLKNLDKARRYFSFCFTTRGMCFIDMAYLQKNNIRSGVIRYVRKKTGQQIEVKLTNEMKEIIDSFSEETINSPYVFPIIKEKESNHRIQYESGIRIQNIRLKNLANLAGISKPLSTHWARHTWATIGKLENIPLRVISECLGHTSEKTTLIYLQQLDNSLLDAANEKIISAVHAKKNTSIWNVLG